MSADKGDEIELGQSLSLVPKYEVEFTFFRKEVAPPVIDEWQLKETLIEVMKRQAKFTLANDRDLRVQKEPNLARKRREEPVAKGTLMILGSAKIAGATSAQIHSKLNGLELRVAGTKLICQTSLGSTVSFVSMQEEWEREHGSSVDGYKSLRPGDRPDTLHIKGLPPRWLAEPRVSPNPSVLVTHTLFSTFGNIRKVEIIGQADVSKVAREVGGALALGAGLAARLQCEVVVQYEDFSSFCKAVRALAGRVMKKAGSDMVASYSLEWDPTDFFSEKNVRQRRFEKEREADEERRRLEAEQRRREWNEKKAELAQLEKRRREAEEREQALREEEEMLKQEEEEAQRAEEERIRLEEERRREEEERVREEEERRVREEWEAEQRRIKEEEERKEQEAREEEEARRREAEEKRLREELHARLEEEMRRVQARKREVEEQSTRRERERRLRAQVEERMRDRIGRDRDDERRRGYATRDERRRGSPGQTHRRDETEEDRWRLDGTRSAASLDSMAVLKQAAMDSMKARPENVAEDEGQEGEGMGGEKEEAGKHAVDGDGGGPGEEEGEGQHGGKAVEGVEEAGGNVGTGTSKRLKSTVVCVT